MDGNQGSSKGNDTTMHRPLKALMEKLRNLSVSVCTSALEIGREEQRRVIHALKVGIALTLASFLYLLEPLFEGVGQNAMWAVMTVVVVLEYTAGATLCKGLNRGLGTLCAGLLAFFIEAVVEGSGKVFRALIIGASVFIVGFAATYLRFFPNIKKNYDYGVMVFLLTFNLITVSSYRVKNILGLARDRLYTIAIGCSICLIISLLILPNWSGEDLHNSTVYKLDNLAKSIEACVKEYFQDEDIKMIEEKATGDPVDKSYREVLDSKSRDETLAQFASWEPRCTRIFHRYPWKQYVKLGTILRHFGYTAVALHGCLNSQIQAPRSIRAVFRAPCTRVAGEVSTVLSELACSIRDRHCFSPQTLRNRLHDALQDLNSAIKSQPRLFLSSKSNNKKNVDWKSEKNTSKGVALSSVKTDVSALTEWSRGLADSQQSAQLRPTLSKIAITSLEFSEALPFAAFSSLLVEMVARLDLVIDEVEKLGKLANFEEFSEKGDIVIDLSDKDNEGIENGRELQKHHTASQEASLNP